jgi:hypothetical protein
MWKRDRGECLENGKQVQGRSLEAFDLVAAAIDHSLESKPRAVHAEAPVEVEHVEARALSFLHDGDEFVECGGAGDEAREVVARARGQNDQWNRVRHKAVDRLVHGAVAANHAQHVCVRLEFGCEAHTVARSLRQSDGHVETEPRRCSADIVDERPRSSASRIWVGNDGYLHSDASHW